MSDALRRLVPDAYPAVPELPANAALIDTVTEDLLACSINLDDLDEFVHSDDTATLWQGEAAEAYVTRSQEIGRDAQAISTTLRQAAQAVNEHSEDVARISVSRDNAADAQVTYTTDRNTLLTDIDLAGDDPSTLTVEDLTDRATALVRRRNELDSDVQQYTSALESSTSTLLTALGSCTVAQMSAGRQTRRVDLADLALNQPGSPTRGASVEEVTAWWASLTEDEQYAAIAARPELVGNADGIPIAVRDQANRLLLEADLEALEWREANGQLLDGDITALANARAVRDALDWAAQQPDPVTNETLIPLLYLYDARAFGGDGKAGIALGNPDYADNVSILVPGMNTRADSIGKYTEDAYSIYEASRLSDPDASMSSLIWIGYDAPSDFDLLTVAAERRATDGGTLLSQFVNGLRSTNQGSPAHITVIGHSYGSTTIAHAAADDGLAIDDLVLVGSPGAGGGIDHASQLGLPAGKVWVGRNSQDLVTTFGSEGIIGLSSILGAGLGQDPSEDTFGATRFRAEAADRGSAPNFGDHGKYFKPDTESIFNLGMIVSGNDEQVLTAEHARDPWYMTPIDPEADRAAAPPDREPS